MTIPQDTVRLFAMWEASGAGPVHLYMKTGWAEVSQATAFCGQQGNRYSKWSDFLYPLSINRPRPRLCVDCYAAIGVSIPDQEKKGEGA